MVKGSKVVVAGPVVESSYTLITDEVVGPPADYSQVQAEDTRKRIEVCSAVVRKYGDEICDSESYRHENADTVLTDLLADLRHWADHMGIDYDHVDSIATGHYLEERTAEL